MILFLHNRYRFPGGEERVVEDLTWLVETHLNEPTEILSRDSTSLSKGRAGLALLRGGIGPSDVSDAVRNLGARVVHAHNIHPLYGWRALAAARAAGARVVLHLHNYRLVCATGICFRNGDDCTRCQGRHTLPGVRHRCRGGSSLESATYAAALALAQSKIRASVDAFIVPSAFALDRLHQLGAPLGERASVIASVQRNFAESSNAKRGEFALVSGRLVPEKGFADAITALKLIGRPLVVAGQGPDEGRLRALAGDADIRFVGSVSPARLAELRAQAAVAIVPTHYQEILPLAALEAMAAGLPLVAARSGGLVELVPNEGLFPIGDSSGLAERVKSLWGCSTAGERALKRVRAISAPKVVADALAAVYGSSDNSQTKFVCAGKNRDSAEKVDPFNNSKV